MKRLAAILGSLVVAGGALQAVASPGGQGVDARQHRQHHRIEQGVRSGELTRREAARATAQQRHIRAEERRYRADGNLGPVERADLRRDQARASRGIHRQKHDAQDRPPAELRDPRVNARQGNQRARIGQGVRSGELTRDEAVALAQEQRSIRQQERAYKSDGELTKEERQDLRLDVRQSGRSIAREKNDEEQR